MFLVRPATIDDAPTLLKLAKMVHFINLPADTDIIRNKILRSRKSFAGKAPSPREREFVFVLQDTDSGNVVGTSSIIPCNSWPGKPHTFLQVRKRELYSTDLQSGQVHLTLQLGTDETGPTEIGGLVLGPSFRRHVQKLGMILSLIRFQFIGMHRDWFADRIIAEMMGPLTPDSRNLFWEYLGRRFINLSFAEADLFCQHSREFITSLFPKEEIYASLLPAVGRSLIGKVGAETEPAKRLLEHMGFTYHGHIDPFDGGPYIEAATAEIEMVRATHQATATGPADEYPIEGFVSVHRQSDYRGVRTRFAESNAGAALPPEISTLLEISPGDAIWLTPLVVPAASGSGTAHSARHPATAPPEAVP